MIFISFTNKYPLFSTHYQVPIISSNIVNHLVFMMHEVFSVSYKLGF
jgi:hypothetical protein